MSISSDPESDGSIAIINMDDPDLVDETTKPFTDDELSSEDLSFEPSQRAKLQRPAKIGYGDIEEMPAQHIRLFAPWIFDPSLDLNQLYADILSESDVDSLNDALSDKDEYEKLKNYFYTVYDILGTDQDAQKFLRRFLQVSPPRSAEIKHKIYFTHPDIKDEAFFTYWEKLLNHPVYHNIIDRIVFSMPVDPILEYLKTSSEFAYRAVFDKLKVYAERDTYENLSMFETFCYHWKVRCQILIELITAKPKKHKPEHWYCEFLKACNTSPMTRGIAFVLEKDFRNILDEYDIVISQLSKPTHKSTEDFVDPSEAPTQPRPQKLFGTKPVDITGEYSANYELRAYQKELTKKAVEGLNTIICAPTGSGKTHVAAEIISCHLRRLRHGYKIGRVAMFVPTIPLVNQQSSHLSANLRPEFYVEKLSGAERSADKGDIRKAETLLQADVIVLTPQIFINMLLSPLRSQKIYLADFTMFVFDECHHCNEQHPYNVLMNFVRESEYKPQIVGLTASVGDGSDSKSRMNADNAMGHMIGICARLNADTITSIRDPDNLLEMHHHISKPIDDIITLRPSEVDNFAHAVALISDHIQAEIHDELATLVTDLMDFKEVKLPVVKNTDRNGSSKASFSYNGKLGMLKYNIDKRDINRERRHFLLKTIELLEICHFTLKNNELMPAKLALEYMQERIGYAERFGAYEGAEKDTEIGNYMKRLRGMINYIKENYEKLDGYVTDSNRKPIYDKLLTCIQEQFENDSGSRIIVFVESRKGCVKMADCVRETDIIAKTFGSAAVGYIVSVNQSMANFGQSSVIQDRTLKEFRQGRKNILFATSVAEEGLDVAQCNLIIKYNSVGSEKSYIQRRGRARAKNSRSVLLAISSSVATQEYNNIMREYLMNMCLNNLQTISEQELKQMISKRKDEIQIALEQERKLEAERKKQSNLYDLVCFTCGDPICCSNEVARLMESQFICCNPFAWRDTKIKQRFDKNFSTKVSSLCGEWVCKCGRKRGEVIKYGEAYLPTIAADGFRLLKLPDKIPEENNKFTWQTVTKKFFPVGAISHEQIRKMINALADNNMEAFSDAQINEEMGICEAVKKLEYEKKDKHALTETY